MTKITIEKPVETDVLVVGGGIGGLMAAIGAAEPGVKVILADKANTKRSGSGATGNDHFMAYIPEYHGAIEPIISECFDSLGGKSQDKPLIVKHFTESFERIKDWNDWGIPMQVEGKWEFNGHAYPGRPRIWLKYAGAEQKIILTREAKKRNVTIMNKLPIVDLITDNNRVIGAIGLNIKDSEPTIQVIRAKNVILATGHAVRLYPSITPGVLFNTARCPSSTGTGRAIAYRAGAKLINMELAYTHSGPRYFARAGKATWIGVLKDSNGKPVGPFVTKPSRELGDITADVWNSVFTDMFKSGRGPVYMDCTDTSPDDMEYMLWGLRNEGNTGMLNYMKETGIDFKKHMVEFGQYEINLRGRGGIEVNENAETCVKGLYAVGDELGNFNGCIGGAATFGWIAGKEAAARSRSQSTHDKAEESASVDAAAKSLTTFLSREEGATWQEANYAIQQIMNDYGGKDVRSASLLNAGLKYISDLRANVMATMKARDSHELMRCLEVLELIDIGEVVFQAALERDETRGMHKRTDFPFTNPLKDKFITVQKVNNKPLLAWRDQIK